jgi:hypothetical protein
MTGRAHHSCYSDIANSLPVVGVVVLLAAKGCR